MLLPTVTGGTDIMLFQTHPWDYVPLTNIPTILAICATIHGNFCNLARFLSYIHHAQALIKIGIPICYSSISQDHSHRFTCFDLFIGLKVGAWITFLCPNQSQKKCMIHIFFRTSLPVITVPLVSCWSCRLYHTGYAKHSVWSLCHISQTAMLIPDGFWFVQIPGRNNDFCQTISEIRLCNALSRFDY